MKASFHFTHRVFAVVHHRSDQGCVGVTASRRGVEYLAEVYQMPLVDYEGVYIGFPVLFNPAAAMSSAIRTNAGLSSRSGGASMAI